MELLPLDDPRWETYCGGYRHVPYNCISLIRQLDVEGTSEAFWETVWNELHHQGDVGEATYAIVPYLARYLLKAETVDPMILAFVSVVEIERPLHDNPAIPPELLSGYEWGLYQLLTGTLAKSARTWDESLLRSYASLLAVVKGQRILGLAYQEMGNAEAREFLANFYDDPTWRMNR